jgi:hypothetical protein
MVYHPGKVLEMFPKKAKEDSTQAMVEFWDENLSTVLVDRNIENTIKKGDTVLVDYYPAEAKPHNPRWIAVKVVEEKKAEAVWKRYKQHHSKLKMMQSSTVMQPQHNVGVG